MYRRILVPTDGSPCSDQGVRHALRLAKRVHGEVVFLHVLEPLLPVTHAGYPAFAARAEDQDAHKRVGAQALARAESLARKVKVRSRSRLVGPAGPEETIVQIAAGGRFALIVMGSHGRRGVRRLVLGSVTEGVLRGTTKPLLVVHCAEERRASFRGSARASSSRRSGGRWLGRQEGRP